MKKVTKFETFDGVLHDNEKKAAQYLGRVYVNVLDRLSARMVDTTDGKYVKTQEFIDANLDTFVELKMIKDDLEIID